MPTRREHDLYFQSSAPPRLCGEEVLDNFFTGSRRDATLVFFGNLRDRRNIFRYGLGCGIGGKLVLCLSPDSPGEYTFDFFELSRDPSTDP